MFIFHVFKGLNYTINKRSREHFNLVTAENGCFIIETSRCLEVKKEVDL